IATRPDWCISRQRVWGVPIIAFYCENCQEPLTDRKILDRVVALFAKESSDAWYDHSAAELVGADAACAKCGGREFRKDRDILDVWFDSGSSHLAVLDDVNGLPWPSNLYLEGADQYRGWFHSSLLVGVALRGEAPYKECATNGWTLDEQGRAMSKSLGIGIHPDQIIPKFGADVLRLWAASVDFTEDVRLSETILQRLTDAYRKYRNTFRWALGNLSDFDPARDAVPGNELLEIDRWVLLRAEALVAQCRAWYDQFAFHKVYRAVYDFFATELSAIYIDASKDALYTAAPKALRRRSAQTAIYRLTHSLVRLIAPLLAFTTEEVWGHLAKSAGDPESVHLMLFPEPDQLTGGLTKEQKTHLADWEKLVEVRNEVLKALETARQNKFIGAPLEAFVRLHAGAELFPRLEKYSSELPGLFIVSQVELERGSEGLQVEVERARGQKCERCWKYTTDVGRNPEFPTICAACAEALAEITGE
ncbi:MAG TPA: class I tRNA ligase family protein, partial [Bryobacteraceae bacterium]|nr:class I tRNA ligase family protein [Bryobacteraceae bacterium]